MRIKQTLVAMSLVLALGSGACTSYHAVATAPGEGKVFVTKTTSYIIWSSNKMQICDFNGTSATNCVKVTQN